MGPQGPALRARAPYGAGWPEVANEAQTIFVYVSEPSDPGHYFVQLLAFDAEGYEVGRKQLGAWEA
jgi:hypothetical protein